MRPDARSALELLCALPARPGRFLLGPGLAGGRFLVGIGSPEAAPPGTTLDGPWLDRALVPGPRGTVLLLGHELGRSLLRTPARANESLGVPRGFAIRIEQAVAIDADGAVHPFAGPPLSTRAPPPSLGVGDGRPAQSSLSRAAHSAAIERVHDYLRAGDAYQINLTARLSAPLPGRSEALLAALLASTAPACAAHLELPGGASVVSASPETLLTLAPDGLARSWPIKGTRRRGASGDEDDALTAELAADEKERAEHVMIVDLVRNDLGRVAARGSVSVPRPLYVDRLPAVLHLVSEVQARLGPGRTPAELVRALFPAGSITGAPKIRALEIIDELEPVARGAYCGSIGLLGPDGGCALSVAIRTAVCHEGRAHYGAGGGITIGSTAAREWEELVLKAAPFLRAVGAAPPG